MNETKDNSQAAAIGRNDFIRFRQTSRQTQRKAAINDPILDEATTDTVYPFLLPPDMRPMTDHGYIPLYANLISNITDCSTPAAVVKGSLNLLRAAWNGQFVGSIPNSVSKVMELSGLTDEEFKSHLPEIIVTGGWTLCRSEKTTETRLFHPMLCRIIATARFKAITASITKRKNALRNSAEKKVLIAKAVPTLQHLYFDPLTEQPIAIFRMNLSLVEGHSFKHHEGYDFINNILGCWGVTERFGLNRNHAHTSDELTALAEEAKSVQQMFEAEMMEKASMAMSENGLHTECSGTAHSTAPYKVKSSEVNLSQVKSSQDREASVCSTTLKNPSKSTEQGCAHIQMVDCDNLLPRPTADIRLRAQHEFSLPESFTDVTDEDGRAPSIRDLRLLVDLLKHNKIILQSTEVPRLAPRLRQFLMGRGISVEQIKRAYKAFQDKCEASGRDVGPEYFASTLSNLCAEQEALFRDFSSIPEDLVALMPELYSKSVAKLKQLYAMGRHEVVCELLRYFSQSPKQMEQAVSAELSKEKAMLHEEEVSTAHSGSDTCEIPAAYLSAPRQVGEF